jgi:MFS family permease
VPRNRTVDALRAVAFASGFAQGVPLALFGRIAAAVHVGPAEIVLFTTAFTIAGVVAAPLLASLGDRIGHLAVLRTAFVLVVVGSVVTALAPSLPVLVAGRVITAPLLASWALVAAIAMGDDAARMDRRMGELGTVLGVGLVLGSLGGGLLVVVVPLAVVLLLPAGVALVALVMLGAARGGDRLTVAPAARASVGRIPSLLAERSTWPVLVSSLLTGFGIYGLQTVMTTFLEADARVHGYGFALSPPRIALFSTANSLALVLGSVLFAVVVRRLGVRRMLVGSAACGALALAALLVAPGSLVVVGVAIVSLGLAGGVYVAAFPVALTRVAPPGRAAVATGVASGVRTLGGGVASAGFGAVLGWSAVLGTGGPSIDGYRTVWAVCLTASVLSLAALLALPRHRVPV